ncbi:uncharacterized protein cfap92 isoform X1 [Lepisosteus oculatus]|uniref:uncharacterized protein cfap92 isoform X1 n=1 Tax=Lepisosteus oculatus TaxID=7918 RepID=UPI0037107834
MDPSDSGFPSESERSNTNCSLKHQSPVEDDSGVATDDGGRETERDAFASCSDGGDDKSECSSRSQTAVTANSSRSKTESSCSSHVVAFTVSIAIAIPKGEEDEQGLAVEKERKRPKNSSGFVESPKAQGYYHIEYSLFPDDPEPTKIDLVMFGLAAKIYMENETKILKPWQEGEQIWLGWSQCVELKVTRELLLKLISHRITFRVWDTKDKVSAKAKYDRPKAFRLPQGKSGENPDNIGGVQSMVLKQRKLFEKGQPKASYTGRKEKGFIEMDTERQSKLNCIAAEPKCSAPEIGISEKLSSATALHGHLSTASEGEDVSPQRSLSCLGDQEGALPDSKSAKLEVIPEHNEHITLRPAEKKSALDQSKTLKQISKTVVYPRKSSSARERIEGTGRRRALCKETLEGVVAVELMRKNGVATAELDLINFLAGDKSVTNCLNSSSPDVREGFCTVSVDKSLISEELRIELNPLVIKIESATSMPTSPVAIHKLKEICAPVYCCYKFHNMNTHRTKGRPHGTHVYFRDVNVILTGLLSPGELREYLRGTPLEIEVHDRDRKKEKPPTKPALFGAEPEDKKLSCVGLVSSRRTTHNPFKHKTRSYDPYGIAKVDLSDLLQGETSLKVRVPIHSSPPPDPTGKETSGWDGRIVGLSGSVDGPEDPPLPTGHYLDSNSQLKISIEVTCPLPQELDIAEGPISDCPFGRIIYIFRYNNTSVLSQLRAEISRINAAAFQLHSYPDSLIENALSCYKLKPKERESRNLDIVTGFHVQDGEIHLFILEGLKSKAIRRLWENIPAKSSSADVGHVEVLYNSELWFQQRLYATLDINVCQIHLHEPLVDIMRQPLLYVRDMVPLACFQALSRLDLICKAKKLKDVAHGNLFPSAEMILSVSKEFGIMEGGKGASEELGRAPDLEGAERKTLTAKLKPQRSPIDTHNIEYVQWKAKIGSEHQGLQKDFIKDNIEEVHQASMKIQRPKPDTIAALPAPGKEAHNYSTHALNSTEQAKELLRREMAKDTSRRFTYSQEYLSATADPVDIERELKASEARSKAAWRTYDGFTYPGFKSSIESNEHHRKPDEAHIEELRKPWRENILHANSLQPTLARDRWSWSKRNEDFELYKKPPLLFSPVPPASMFLAGDHLHDEQLQAARKQYMKWLHKVLATHDMKLNRYSLEFKCHTAGGNMDRFQELLKDKPMKYSLRRPGMVLKPIPALSVIQDPYESVEEVRAGFAPGLLEHHSLSWDKNLIPRSSFQQLKGQPFIGYWKDRSFRYKRAANPLTEEERSGYLFQQQNSPSEAAVAVKTQPLKNIVETQTYCNVIMQVI